MTTETKTSPVAVKPNSEGAKAKSSTDNQHLITKNFPASLNANETGKLEMKAETRQTNEHEKWYSNPDFYVAGFTGLLVVVTGFLAVYTWRLWRDAKDSASKTIKTMEDTARKELRAYVALDEIYFPWTPNGSDLSDRSFISQGSDAKVRIKNLGRTPANNVTLRLSGTQAIPNTDFERLYRSRYYKAPKQMLSPNQEYATRVPSTVFALDPYCPTDSVGREAFIYGAIIYEDIYNRWWVTRFCYMYDSDPLSRNRFIPHTDYNNESEYKSEKEALDSLSYEELS